MPFELEMNVARSPKRLLPFFFVDDQMHARREIATSGSRSETTLTRLGPSPLSHSPQGERELSRHYSPLFLRFLIHRTVPVAERMTTVSVVT